MPTSLGAPKGSRKLWALALTLAAIVVGYLITGWLHMSDTMWSGFAVSVCTALGAFVTGNVKEHGKDVLIAQAAAGITPEPPEPPETDK